MRASNLRVRRRLSALRKKQNGSCKALLLLATAGVATGLSSRSAHAGTYVFDPSLSSTGGSDGAGSWNTTTSDWFNTSGGTSPQLWSNSTSDTALFGVGGTAGTVAVTAVKVGTIQFTTTTGTYDLTSSTASAITLGGASTINTNGTNVLFGLAANGLTLASGTNAINKVGAGILTIANDQNSTGGLPASTTWNVSGGTLASTGVYSSGVAIFEGQALGVSTGNTLNLSAGSLIFTANGGAGYSSARTINVSSLGGAISDGGFAPGTPTAGGGVINPNINVAAGAGLNLIANNILNFDGGGGVIAGAGGITTYGTGTVRLQQVNTYQGPTNISSGTLQVGNGTTGSLGATPSVSIASNATLAIDVSAAYNLGAVPISGAGSVVLNGPLLAGAVTLDSANTYTGVTNISGGSTLTVSSLPNGLTASPIGASSNASGNLIIAGTAGTTNALGNGVFLVYTGGTATTDRGISLGGTVQNTINVSSGSAVLTIAGQIVALPTASAYRFFKQGPGTLAFTNVGPNAFNSNQFFLVDAGTLQLGAPGQVNNIANGLIVGNQLATPGATPTFNMIGGTTNVTGPLYFSNGDPNTGQNLFANISNGTLNVTGVQTIVNGTNNAILNLSGTGVIADTGNLVGVSTTGATVVMNISGTSQFDNTGGAISYMVGGGGGTSTVNQTGGVVTFNAGLQVNGAGTSVETGTYNLGNGTLGSGTLDTLSLSGNSTNGASTAVVNFNGGTLQAFGNNTAFVTGLTSANVLAGGAVVDSQAFNVTIASPLLNGTGGGADGGLTKLGSGTLILTGSSTYTGQTNISAGTLQLGNATTAGTLASTVPISGAGGLTYAEPLLSVAVTPNSANTYAGATNISGGTTLSVSSLPNGGVASSIGSSSNASSNLILNPTVGVQNAFGNGVTLLYTGTGTQTTDRGITFSGNATTSNTINVSSGTASLTIGGQITNISYGDRIYKEGLGTLAFTYGGTNTFSPTGGTNEKLAVDAGTLILGAPGQVNIISSDLIVGQQLSTLGSTPTLDIIDGTTTAGDNGLGLGNDDGNGNSAFAGQNLIVNMIGGTLNVPQVYTGSNGSQAINAFLNISGGTINDAGNFGGGQSNGVTTLVTISGAGTFNVTGAGVSYLATSAGATGTVSQTGGTFNVSGTLAIAGQNSNSVGAYNLNGGTLVTPVITLGTGSGTLNFNGGTLQTPAAANTQVGGLSAINVQAGGAYFNSLGNTIFVNQALTHDPGGSAPPLDGGVIKTGTGTLILAGNGTYAGNTQVTAGNLVVSSSTALGTGSAVLSDGTRLVLGTIANGTPVNVQTGLSGFTTNSNGGDSPVIAGDGSSVTLTDGNGGEATSVFSPTPVTINDANGFTASFTYNHTLTGTQGQVADGIAFVIQNQGSGAVANSGGAFGYGAGTVPGISPSVAAVVDEYKDEIGYGLNGVITETGLNSAPGISAQGSSNVTVVYDGAAKTLTETVTNNQGTYSTVLTGFDLEAQLGEGGISGLATGYIGFSGGTGAIVDTISVSNFTFNTSASSGVSMNNGVTVLPGASSVVQLAPTAPYSSGGVGPISIGTGGLLTVSIGSTPAAGVVRGVLGTTSVTFANSSSGILDVGTNALDITGQTLGAVNAMVAGAYSKGTWTGPGITSTAAANDSMHLTALGVISNTPNGTQLYGTGTALGLFDGANPGGSDVLVKYTYYGDTDLSGVVDGSDYARIDYAYLNNQTNPGSPLTGWFNGDFNYDGVIDGSDYTLMDNAFNTQGASLSAQIASPTAQIGGGSAVPEPATLTLVGIGALSLLGRRRRRI